MIAVYFRKELCRIFAYLVLPALAESSSHGLKIIYAAKPLQIFFKKTGKRGKKLGKCRVIIVGSTAESCTNEIRSQSD